MRRIWKGVSYFVIVSLGTVAICGAFGGALDALVYAFFFVTNLPQSWETPTPQYAEFDRYLREVAPMAVRYRWALVVGLALGAAAFVYGLAGGGADADAPEDADLHRVEPHRLDDTPQERFRVWFTWALLGTLVTAIGVGMVAIAYILQEDTGV